MGSKCPATMGLPQKYYLLVMVFTKNKKIKKKTLGL
jgi:hypothetical protein